LIIKDHIKNVIDRFHKLITISNGKRTLYVVWIFT